MVRFLVPAFLLGASIAAVAQDYNDVMDKFNRNSVMNDQKAYFSSAPEEVVDPYTGTLSLVFKDVVLPGRNGFDLTLYRVYNSKIYGRSDPEIGSGQDGPYPTNMLSWSQKTSLGWGWSMHMGLLRNGAMASGGNSGSSCEWNHPTFEAPNGTTVVFYPTSDPDPGANCYLISNCGPGDPVVWRSTDNWQLLYWDRNDNTNWCVGRERYVVYSPQGVKYEFPALAGNGSWTYEYGYPAAPAANDVYVPCRIFPPEVSYPPAQPDYPHIEITYRAGGDPNTGCGTSGRCPQTPSCAQYNYGPKQLLQIKDVEGRVVDFKYCTHGTSNPPGMPKYDLLDTITVGPSGNSKQLTIEYQYASKPTGFKVGVSCVDFDMLTEVKAPRYTGGSAAAPSWQFDYANLGSCGSTDLGKNKGGLSKITYPGGGTVEYTYDEVTSDTAGGGFSVKFPLVATRTETPKSGTSYSWQYKYDREPGSGYDRTMIVRPDGFVDFFKFYGMRNASNGNVYLIGRPAVIERGATDCGTWPCTATCTGAANSNCQHEEFTWSPSVAISDWDLGISRYGANDLACDTGKPIDNYVYAAQLDLHTIVRDGTTYKTEVNSADYDPYHQPTKVLEYTDINYAKRTTEWTYDHPDVVNNLVVGFPTVQKVDVKVDSSTGGEFYNRWAYSSMGQLLTKEVSGNSSQNSGIVTSYQYSPAGSATSTSPTFFVLTKVTDGSGRYVHLSGYSGGQPSEIKNGTYDVGIEYNIHGWLTKYTPGNTYGGSNLGWRYEYDGAGRAVTQIPPLSSQNSTTIAYGTSAAASRTKRVTRGSAWTETWFDDIGRATGTKDSTTAQTQTLYDEMARVTRTSLPYSLTVGTDSSFDSADDSWFKYLYDPLGRLTKTETRTGTPSGGTLLASSRVEYDTGHVHAYDQRDHEQRTYFKEFGAPGDGRMTQVKDVEPGGTDLYYFYDYNDQGSLTRNQENGTSDYRSYVYDNRGNLLTKEVNFETGNYFRYWYDGAGRLTERQDDRMGATHTTFLYDGVGRRTKIDYGLGSGEDATFVYDKNNNVTKMSSANGGTKTYTVDDADRMNQQVFSYGSYNWTSEYEYSANDKLTLSKYPWTGTVTTDRSLLGYSFDPNDRLTYIDDTSSAREGYLNDFKYNPGNFPRSAIFRATNQFGSDHDAAYLSWLYDNRHRLTQMVACPTSSSCAGTGGSQLAELDYMYDAESNITSYRRYANGGVSTDETKQLEYDAFHRLTKSYRTWTGGNNETTTYEYNPHDDRTKMVVTNSATTTTQLYAIDGSHHLITKTTNGSAEGFTYDEIGDLTSRGDGEKYYWDDANRASKITDTSGSGTTYRYDALGRLVAKTPPGLAAPVVYHYDPQGAMMAESNPSTGSAVYDYVFANGMLIARQGHTASSRYYYHVDHQGSVVSLSSDAGTPGVSCDFLYEPFGYSGQVACSEMRYDSRMWDGSGGGLYYYGARWYEPRLGRFVSADTSRGALTMPRTHNRYIYVTQDPYHYVDPAGNYVVLSNDATERGEQVGRLQQLVGDENALWGEQDDCGGWTLRGAPWLDQLGTAARALAWLIQSDARFDIRFGEDPRGDAWTQPNGEGGATITVNPKKFPAVDGGQPQTVDSALANELGEALSRLLERRSFTKRGVGQGNSLATATWHEELSMFVENGYRVEHGMNVRDFGLLEGDYSHPFWGYRMDSMPMAPGFPLPWSNRSPR